jgi:hypothetical protein
MTAFKGQNRRPGLPGWVSPNSSRLPLQHRYDLLSLTHIDWVQDTPPVNTSVATGPSGSQERDS